MVISGWIYDFLLSFSSLVEELECLAQWKEGSARYMVGLLKYHHDPSSYEERFRCFAYEMLGNKLGSGGDGSSLAESYTLRRTYNSSSSSGGSPGRTRLLDGTGGDGKVAFRVAQSGDATCLGLTPTEGSRTLTLRRGKVNLSQFIPTAAASKLEKHPSRCSCPPGLSLSKLVASSCPVAQPRQDSFLCLCRVDPPCDQHFRQIRRQRERD